MVDQAIPGVPKKARWIQTGGREMRNPFFGKEMLDCGEEIKPSDIMIEKIIEWSLRNRFLVICGALMLIALGIRAIYLTPGGRHPGPHGKPGARLCRLDGPQPAGGRGPGDLSALHRLAGARRREGGARHLDVRILARSPSSSRTRSTPTSPAPGCWNAELPPGLDARGREAATRPDASGLGWVYQYYLHVDPDKAQDGGYDLAQAPLAPGLVNPLSTRQRAGRGRSRQHRRLREAVSDRAVLHQDARRQRHADGGDGRRAERQPQRRRQNHRGKRRGVRPARHRPGHQPGGSRTRHGQGGGRHADLSEGHRHRPDRRRLPPRRARPQRPGSRGRHGRHAHRRERQGRHRAGEGKDRAKSPPACRPASPSGRSTTAAS